jgi:osmotically-inducible protein OsmY
MSETQPDEPKQYVVARMHEALAKDGRVNELEIDITLAGRKVFLTGEVTTAARKDAISAVAKDCLPDYEIVNEVNVTSLGAPEPETLS